MKPIIIRRHSQPAVVDAAQPAAVTPDAPAVSFTPAEVQTAIAPLPADAPSAWAQRPLIERGILYLAGHCDGAATLDGVGFNGRDTILGRSFAQQLLQGKTLTPGQRGAAFNILHTYLNTQLKWLPREALRAEHEAYLKTVEGQKSAKELRAEAVQKETDTAYSLSDAQLAAWIANVDMAAIDQRDKSFISDLLQWHKRGMTTPSRRDWLKRMAVRYAACVRTNPTVERIATQPVQMQRKPFVLRMAAKTGAAAPMPVVVDAVHDAQLLPATEAAKIPLELAAEQWAKLPRFFTSDPALYEMMREHAQRALPIDPADRLEDDMLQGEVEPLPQTVAESVEVLVKRRRLELNPDGSIPTMRFTRGGQDLEITPDASQWQALQGLRTEQFGCMTGAAGTGKTTVERGLVMDLEDGLPEIDITDYAKANPEYTADRKIATAIAFAAYTGKAMQQMKRALPQEYHGRCMTIHSLLGFHPEWFDVTEFNPELRQNVTVTKRRFVPYFDAGNKLPWRTIVLDEGSMIPIHLWDQLLAAMKSDCRVFMIGDINQLPPVHGRSVFGFAMLKWPSFELTQIHRQKGEDNPIVDNAWRVLRGELPENVPGRFDMIRLPNSAKEAFQLVCKATALLHRREQFAPMDTDDRNGDMLITAQNKDVLGQVELNNWLMTYFNPPTTDGSGNGDRVIVTAGYETRAFAVNDKVMATVNNHEIGITNGMTGTIVHIGPNGRYTGKHKTVASSHADIDLSDIGSAPEFKLTETAGVEEKSEDFKSRAASHILTVDFGRKENGERHAIDFATTGEVQSLMHAYAATCHKCQGSEFDTIIIVCHASNHRMLFREWLYTAITRARLRVVLLYNDRGLAMALRQQRIKGKNLQEKAQSFIDLMDKEDAKIPTLPEPRKAWMPAPLPAKSERSERYSGATADYAVVDDVDTDDDIPF